MKNCARCGQNKPVDCFGRLSKAKDGLHSWCRQCAAERKREDRASRPEYYSEIERRRHHRHGDARRKKNREWHAEMPPDIRAKRKTAAQSKAEQYNANRRAVFADSALLRMSRADANKRWRWENAQGVKARRKEAWANATPLQRLRSYFGSAIAHALAGTGKGGRSWQNLVGYTSDELKKHLERQFVSGMSWENYGTGWHVDHIIPASLFEYSSPDDEEFRACWSLTNLRPLWAVENIRKRDNRTLLI